MMISVESLSLTSFSMVSMRFRRETAMVILTKQGLLITVNKLRRIRLTETATVTETARKASIVMVNGGGSITLPVILPFG